MLVDENDQPIDHPSLNMKMLHAIEEADDVTEARRLGSFCLPVAERYMRNGAIADPNSAEVHRHLLLDMIEQLLAELHPEPEPVDIAAART